ncbi:LysR family transcriptional regulator [Alcanivorax sp. IO_7]|nr:LysR family transcriptional regulator [Alcanivorax sp. IO_7]
MLIRSLEIFRAVVDSGSFSAAAERLHTVQSNVTAHVKKLETELDARLLERRNPVVATPAGRQLLAYARRIVELHDDALSRFRPGGEPLASCAWAAWKPPPPCICRVCSPTSAGAGRSSACTCTPAPPAN